MPDYFQPQNPWLGAARAGQGLGDTIQSALLQVPKAQAEGRMMQQEFLMNQLKMQQEQQLQPFQTDLLKAQTGAEEAKGKTSMAEAGMYDSEAALNRAKQGQLTQQDQLHVKLGQDMGNFVKESLTTGKVSPETAQTLAQSLATLDKLDPQLMPSIMKEISISASGMGTDKGLAASVVSGYKVPERTTLAPGATSFETMNPGNKQVTAPGRPVNEDANDTKLIVSLLQQGVDPKNVVAMAKDIRSKMGFGQMQNAPSPSGVDGQGEAPTNTPTATNPQTGQKIKLVNGQWIPAQ